jgi:tetratricopeptide (TPR) repeat protein
MVVSRDIFNIVSSLIGEKKFSDAEELLLEELAKEPASIKLLNRLADLYLRMSRYPESESLIERALSIDPGNYYSLRAKGDLYAAKKNFSRAAEIFFDLERGTSDDFFLLKRIAKVLRLSGKGEEALRYAKKAINIKPDRADIYYLLSQICRDLGDFPEALASIDKAIHIEPKNSLYSKEKLSLRVDEKGLASEDIRETIDLSDNENPQMLKLLGEQLKKEKRFPEVVEVYSRLLELEPNGFNRRMLAFAYYKIKEFNHAFRHFMLLDDTQFHDNIFLTSVIYSAQSEEEKLALLDRMDILVKNPAYKKLWAKIKKIRKELEAGADEKDS